jgi:hypothetical protein
MVNTVGSATAVANNLSECISCCAVYWADSCAPVGANNSINSSVAAGYVVTVQMMTSWSVVVRFYVLVGNVIPLRINRVSVLRIWHGGRT